jgi:hypothetical protein
MPMERCEKRSLTRCAPYWDFLQTELHRRFALGTCQTPHRGRAHSEHLLSVSERSRQRLLSGGAKPFIATPFEATGNVVSRPNESAFMLDA